MLHAVSPGERYRSSWESYWHDITESSVGIFWDAEPERAAALDLPLLKAHFNPELPVVDFGCGNGTQTRFLGHHYPKAIGVDVSPAALAAAREATLARNVEYRLLDALAPDEGKALHGEIGDANVYIRGVLHQFQPADRYVVEQTLAHLMGERGALYIMELAPEADQAIQVLAQKFGGLPPALVEVFEHGITPAGLQTGDLDVVFPSDRYELLSRGRDTLKSIQPLPDGGYVELPSTYRVFKRRAA